MEKQKLSREIFEVGQAIRAVNVLPLPGKDIGPPLKKGKEYSAKRIFTDSEGNQHLDVGIPSQLNFVKSYETDEELPDGDKIHWCHPSRFESVKK